MNAADRSRTVRPFVDRPITDIAAATDLAQHAAATWDLPQPELLRSGMNAIFVADDAVIRVGAPSAPAATSMKLATALASHDIRVTTPLRHDAISAGPLAATCWEHIVSTGESIDWTGVGEMVRRVHQLGVADVPDGYPTPRPTDFPWWNFRALLDEVGDLLDRPARDGIETAIDRWPNWADRTGAVVCHGDVHPGNVVMSVAGPVLIDWDLLCLAPPGWDHAPMMTWAQRWGGDADDYDRLAAGYGADLRGDRAADAFAELRLVAATLMRLKAGRANPAAMPEAQRRLAYWRGESDAPAWQAQ